VLKYNIFVILLISVFLVGCNDDNNDSDDNNSEIEVDLGLSDTIENISYIEGVYDISLNEDETEDNTVDIVYLSINSDGYINTYDFQGDTVDNGSNCYIKNLSTGYNTSINGLKISHDASNNRFSLDELNWNYDNGEITSVSYGGLSAGTMLGINGLRIATSQNLTTAVTESEMEQLLCN